MIKLARNNDALLRIFGAPDLILHSYPTWFTVRIVPGISGRAGALWAGALKILVFNVVPADEIIN